MASACRARNNDGSFRTINDFWLGSILSRTDSFVFVYPAGRDGVEYTYTILVSDFVCLYFRDSPQSRPVKLRLHVTPLLIRHVYR
jgi:hypothetical protein